ncbi:MAG: glycoside hydrolase family 97 protein [Chitinophagaceae bacterium]
MPKIFRLLLPSLIFFFQPCFAQHYEVFSPTKNLMVNINCGKRLSFRILDSGVVILPDASVSMHLQQEGFLGENAQVKSTYQQSVHEILHPVVAVKNSSIPDDYNQLIISFKGHYSVVFRVYKDAVAYHFVTRFKDSVNVLGENFDPEFPSHSWIYYQGAPRWMNSYEHMYQYEPMDSLGPAQTNQLPMLVTEKSTGRKVLITEADLFDYPGLYFTGENGHRLKSIFPPAVKKEKVNVPGQDGWDRIIVPDQWHHYLARTAGSRSFPWRILAVSNQDKDLLDNEIVFKLAEPDRLKNTSWIQPGLVAWDWWNDWNITGVDFRAGVNTATYKYYIDFAARNGLPYIMMDEGWYPLGHMLHVVPSVDMPAILNYAKKKNVGVFLWCVWKTLDQKMVPIMDQFQRWGVKGIKVDFMNRDDQAIVDFYWRCAAEAARHHLMVDFHGAHKPTGIMRTYPNVMNFEGVPGLEQDKWTDSLTTPKMAVTLPFIRMFAGPMDYTPGAMRNAQLKDFAPINSNPMSLGTRCQQLAMYVLYDAPLQMLADNPTIYENQKECLHFIRRVPTTWDQTVPLLAKVGKYLAVARRKGSTWLVGAMTDWTPRDLTLSFSFLGPGLYHLEIFQDGVNADRNGTDYKKVLRTVTAQDTLTIHLAPGGGWAARIYH